MLRVACAHQFPGGFELDVDLRFDCGITALVGPSGAGKTTVLNIIAGFIKPRRGLISIDDLCLVDTNRNVCLPPNKRRVGYVPQDDLLFPHMTVAQNLRFGERYAARTRSDFDQIAKILELGDLLTRRPSTLSGGQRQRVALGRAFLRGPSVLLMDEPINAQHDALKQQVIEELRRLIDEMGMAAVFVSHDIDDVRRFAKRTIQLENGRVCD